LLYARKKNGGVLQLPPPEGEDKENRNAGVKMG